MNHDLLIDSLDHCLHLHEQEDSDKDLAEIDASSPDCFASLADFLEKQMDRSKTSAFSLAGQPLIKLQDSLRDCVETDPNNKASERARESLLKNCLSDSVCVLLQTGPIGRSIRTAASQEKD